jgi:N6-L-threonylcarbamoyladenine synthase
MIILGIETSCDESAAAIYDSRRGLLSHCLHSQLAVHAPPEAWCRSWLATIVRKLCWFARRW